jgi:hypothetical protein
MIPRRRSVLAALAAALLFAPRLAVAMPEADAAAGRALAAKYADMIISVEVVATLKITIGDHSLPPQEAKLDPNGTVISATGLTVVPLSQIDPRANIESVLRTQARGQHFVLGDTDYKEVKLRRADGSEVPARVVLKDPDLDLAFVAPVLDPAAPLKPFAFVNLDEAAEAVVLADYYVVTRAPKTLQRVSLVRAATLEGIDPKPRTVYIVANTAPGCPVFDRNGRTLGISLFQLNGGRPSASPIVMPAADVADEAKQAAIAATKPPPEPPAADDADAAAASSPAPLPAPKAGPRAAPASEAPAPTAPKSLM